MASAAAISSTPTEIPKPESNSPQRVESRAQKLAFHRLQTYVSTINAAIVRRIATTATKPSRTHRDMARPHVRQAIDKPPRRAALTGRDRLMGLRFSRARRLATRVFWIAVFIAVFLLFSGVLDQG